MSQSHTELAAHMKLVTEFGNARARMALEASGKVVTFVPSPHDAAAAYQAVEASARKLAALESPERVQGEAPDDKTIAMAMLAVDDPLQWGRLGIDGKTMLKQFVSALFAPTPPTAPAQDAQGDLKPCRHGHIHCLACMNNRDATPSPQAETAGAEPGWTQDEIEEVIACLGDDAAQLRDKNPEDERADNMDRAACMVQVFSDALRASTPAERVPGNLHTFLDAAAGEGLVLGGIDAADLYVELFPKTYAGIVTKESST